MREPRSDATAFYRPELDALRCFAFLLVFVTHAVPASATVLSRLGPAAPWARAAVEAGAFGVDLFFCLSAYLITELLLRERRSRGRLDVGAFYARRVLRIWPLYYAALLLAVLLPGPEMPARHAVAFALLVGNWSAAAWGFPASWAAPLWSVSIEEQFYLAWPLVVARLDERRLALVALLLLAIASATRVILAAGGAAHPAVWTNTLARLDPIALGALLALVLRGRAPMLGLAARAALLVGGLIALVATRRWLALDGWEALATYPVAGLASAALLVGVLGGDDRMPWLRWRPLVWLGRISYGLYVVHRLAIDLAWQGTLRGIVPAWAGPVVALALSVAIAAASYRWLESPFLRLKQRFTYVRSTPEPSAP